MKKGLAVFFLLLSCLFIAQNNKLDSLWAVYRNDAHADSIRLKALNAIVWTYRITKPDTALVLAEQLRQWAEKIKAGEYEVNAHNLLGLAFMYKGNYSMSMEAFRVALKKAAEYNYGKGSGDAHNNLGIAYQRQSNFPKALENYLEALRIRESIGDKKGIAGCSVNIGIIYASQSNTGKALHYYSSALAVYEELKDKKGMDVCYNNIGGAFFSQANYAKALEYDIKALSIREELGDKQGVGNCFNNIGGVYFAMSDYTKAMEYYGKAMSLKREAADQSGIATCLGNLGELYNKLDDPKKAIAYLDSSLTISLAIQDKDNELLAYQRLADVYAKTNNFKAAYNYYQKFKLLTDSIFNEENSKQLGDVKISYEVAKKEAEMNALAEKHHAIAREEKKRQGLIISSVTGILVVTLVFSFFLYRRTVRVKRQKQTIEFLYREVHHRVKNNMQVISSLLNLQKTYIVDEKTRDIFQDCQNRIFAMSAIHEKLYEKNVLPGLDFNSYIRNLIAQLIDTYQVKFRIKSNLDVCVNALDLDAIIPIGLLANEIISNSLKYAFLQEDLNNEITFTLKRRDAETFVMTIGDNGVGCKTGLNDEHASFGMELIKMLVSQLHGTIRRLEMKGTMYEIVFCLPVNYSQAEYASPETLEGMPVPALGDM